MPDLAAIDAAMRDSARSAPAIRRLGGGTLAVTSSGDLWRIAGRSAAVYALKLPGGRVLALRIPLEDGTAAARQADRFAAVASASSLAAIRGKDGPLPGDIHVFPDGLTLPETGFRTAPHPVIALEYLPGGSLRDAALQATAESDARTLRMLFASTGTMLDALATAGFDHGALDADAILLRADGSPGLPGLAHAAWPGSFTAIGVAPGRDRLPALRLMAELAALAADPGIAAASPPPGWLLLGPDDLRRPDSSPLLRRMAGSGDPAASALALALRSSLASGQAPEIWETLAIASGTASAPVGQPRQEADRDAAPPPPAAAPGHPDPATPSAPPATRHPPPAPLDGSERQEAITRLNSLLLAGDDAAAAAFWRESGMARDPAIAGDLGPRLLERLRAASADAARAAASRDDPAALARIWEAADLDAYPPAAALVPLLPRRGPSPEVAALQAALAAGDPAAVAAQWPALRGNPEAGLLAPKVNALLARELAGRVSRAGRRGDAGTAVEAAREARAFGVALPADVRRTVRDAAHDLAVRDALAAAIRANDHAAIADLAHAGELDRLGRLPADLAHARDRALAWPHLERALARDDDTAILDAWDPALFEDDPALTPERLARIGLARERIAWLHAVRAALRRRDAIAARALAGEIPSGAEARLSEVERRRLDRLARGGMAAERLEQALRTGPDSAILSALAGVEAAGLPLPEALDWAAVRGVADRVTLAAALRDAATADPPDYRRIARLLPATRAAIGASLTADEERMFAALERDLLRAAAVGRIRDALAGGDPRAIAAAADPDPYGALPELEEWERRVVDGALHAAT